MFFCACAMYTFTTKVVSGVKNLGADIVLYRQGHLSSFRALPSTDQVTSDRLFLCVFTPHGTSRHACARRTYHRRNMCDG